MHLYLVTAAFGPSTLPYLVEFQLAAAFPHTRAFSDHSWLILSASPPEWIKEAIAKSLVPGDHLLVLEVMLPFAGILDRELLDWINDHLPAYHLSAPDFQYQNGV